MADAGSAATPSIMRRGGDSGLSSNKGLRKATPLGAEPSSAHHDTPISLDHVLGSAAASSVSSIRRSGEISSPARRSKKAPPSKWVWIGIGAAMLVGLILVILEIIVQSR
jgi:hypothetical protein